MELNQQAKDFLYEAAKWATFLSIIGFIGIALMVILSFTIGTILTNFTDNNFGIPQQFFSVTYLLIAGIYFVPVYLLFQFGSKTKSAIVNQDTDLLIFGLKKLKSHYKFIGIFAIIVISIYILLFLFSIFAFLLN